MKQKIILLAVTISFLSSKAQTFEPNFLGDDFSLYKGAMFKLKDKVTSSFTFTFYGDIKHCKSANDNHVIYPDSKFDFVTVKDSLANRVFLVEDIIITKDTTNTISISTILDNHKPIFVLKDITTKQVIYYLYDEIDEAGFPFNTSKLSFDENILCTQIEKTVDDFTGEIKLNSPISNNVGILRTIIYKSINKGKTSYYLSLTTYGVTANVNGTGAIILFTDGTKWTRPVKIDVEADNPNFRYSAFITLNQSDLTVFSTKKIKKYRLYIYDEEVNPTEADKFKLYVKCIKDKK